MRVRIATFVVVLGSTLCGCSNGESSPAKIEPSGTCVLEGGICVAKGAGIACCPHTGAAYDEAAACIRATGGTPAIACSTVAEGTMCTANGAVSCVVATGADGRRVYRTPSLWTHEGFESCDEALRAEVTSAPYCAVPSDGGVPDTGPGDGGPVVCNVLASGGTCPEGCTPVEGIPYDVDKKCLAPTKVVACTDPSTEPGEYACRVEIATARPWWFIGGVAPTAPEYPGWRECTPVEASCFPAKPCP